MNRPILWAALVALSLPLAAQAQPTADRQSFPITAQELDGYFSQPPRVEVNLRGALIRMAIQATAQQDPDAAALMEGLRSVTVRIYPLASVLGGFEARMRTLDEALDTQGWMTMVRVRPNPDEGDTEDVRVFVKEDGDVFDGMAVVAIDDEDGDAVFVLIDGRITPDQIGRLSIRFGGPDLDGSDDDDLDDDE